MQEFDRRLVAAAIVIISEMMARIASQGDESADSFVGPFGPADFGKAARIVSDVLNERVLRD